MSFCPDGDLHISFFEYISLGKFKSLGTLYKYVCVCVYVCSYICTCICMRYMCL